MKNQAVQTSAQVRIEERLDEIELKLMHQEDTIDSLNLALYQQQKQLQQSETQIASLVAHIKNLMQSSENSGVRSAAYERPPHY